MPPPSRNHRTPTGPDTPAFARPPRSRRPERSLARTAADAPPSRPAGAQGAHHRPTRTLSRLHRPTHRNSHRGAFRRPLEFAQYVSLGFGQKARDAGIAVSMGSKGCYDNAVAESFFATLKKDSRTAAPADTPRACLRRLRVHRSLLQPHPPPTRPSATSPLSSSRPRTRERQSESRSTTRLASSHVSGEASPLQSASLSSCTPRSIAGSARWACPNTTPGGQSPA